MNFESYLQIYSYKESGQGLCLVRFLLFIDLYIIYLYMKYGLVRRFICFCADIRTASAAAANISRTDCNSFIFCLFNREQSKSTEEIFYRRNAFASAK